MDKAFIRRIAVLVVLASLSLVCSAEEKLSGPVTNGRYQFYSTSESPYLYLVLDTQTGKIWQLTSDLAGKLKAEGIAIEGLAFSNKDLETLNRKISEVDLEDYLEEDKSAIRGELFAVFSYPLDKEKIDAVLEEYPKKR